MSVFVFQHFSSLPQYYAIIVNDNILQQSKLYIFKINLFLKLWTYIWIFSKYSCRIFNSCHLQLHLKFFIICLDQEVLKSNIRRWQTDTNIPLKQLSMCGWVKALFKIKIWLTRWLAFIWKLFYSQKQNPNRTIFLINMNQNTQFFWIVNYKEKAFAFVFLKALGNFNLLMIMSWRWCWYDLFEFAIYRTVPHQL